MKRTKLTSKKEQVFTVNGKYLFSVSMTDKAKDLLDDFDWERETESWIDYRKRTEPERNIEQEKQYKLTKDIAEAYNEKYGLK